MFSGREERGKIPCDFAVFEIQICAPEARAVSAKFDISQQLHVWVNFMLPQTMLGIG